MRVRRAGEMESGRVELSGSREVLLLQFQGIKNYGTKHTIQCGEVDPLICIFVQLNKQASVAFAQMGYESEIESD
jgi:hypothetical protein